MSTESNVHTMGDMPYLDAPETVGIGNEIAVGDGEGYADDG